MDFTLNKYRELLSDLLICGYKIVTFSEYMKGVTSERLVILRHDVDELANNALRMAELEKEMGINATYYFRVVKQSNNPRVIEQIAAMGHEIGYHYEDLAKCNGNYELAIKSFERNLAYFRIFYPVNTVSMHGSSTSRYDNRNLWKKYRLSYYGLIGEPYLSVDFSKVFYLTDTGYAWDGGKYTTRDVVRNGFGLSFHSTDDIIKCINEGQFPKQTMILAHTLWTDNLFMWILLHIREYVRNRLKRVAMRNHFVALFYNKIVSLYWR